YWVSSTFSPSRAPRMAQAMPPGVAPTTTRSNAAGVGMLISIQSGGRRRRLRGEITGFPEKPQFPPSLGPALSQGDDARRHEMYTVGVAREIVGVHQGHTGEYAGGVGLGCPDDVLERTVRQRRADAAKDDGKVRGSEVMPDRRDEPSEILFVGTGVVLAAGIRFSLHPE